MVAPPSLSYFFCVLPVVLILTQAADVQVPVQHHFMSLVGSSAARTLPAHPGQACTLAEGKKWALTIRRTLPADWLSMLNGATPRTLLQYSAIAVPAALVFMVADVANGVPGTPQQSVIARDLEISKTTDMNVARALSKASHEAELRNEFFVALEITLSDSAPLLLDKLRKDHILAFNADMHDGPAAFRAICDRYSPAHIEHVEAQDARPRRLLA